VWFSSIRMTGQRASSLPVRDQPYMTHLSVVSAG